MEEYQEQQDTQEGTSNWLKDNLRIIISMLIVIFIAAGIYSYSKRSQNPEENLGEEQTLTEEEPGVNITEQGNTLAESINEQNKSVNQKEQISSTAPSQETETSFIESAGKGDGQTHLARKALANYLEKNPDSTLTAEHKIYIEDFLRKNSGFKGKIFVGTSVEFSKDNIKEAIGSSQKLSDNQLKNLEKYSARVPSLL